MTKIQGKDMEDIQTQALQTFSKNMEFLNSIDEILAQKIVYLQDAMQKGEYQSNYSLEYKDEGYFDVQNLQDGSWLYGKNSIDVSQKKSDEVTYDKVNSVISLAYRNIYTKQTAEDFEKFSAVNLTMTPPIEHVLTEAKGRGPYINKIFKFAFLGLGLGLHVNMIDEKIQAASYLLVEDNLELFYLSLFVAKYYEINKKAKLFFCILEDSDGFKRVFDDFYLDLWIRNDFLKFSLFSDAYANKITFIQNQVLIRPHFAYPANLLFRKNIRISKVLNEGYKFLNISQIYDNSPLKNKKVLFLAGGPSLNKHVKWVKLNRDKFFVVSVFMIAKRLKNEGIKPDIFVHIDENERPIKNTLMGFEDYSYFNDIKFVLSGSVPLEFFTPLAKKEDIYLVEDRTRYKIGHGNLDYYSVGEAGYALSLIFGANELYLLGLDLALDAETGSTHADGHSSGKVADLNQKDKIQEVGTMDKNVFSVAGNRGRTVPTTPLFAASINAFNSYSRACLVNNQKVYNLSDGALLYGTIPLHVKDITFDSEFTCNNEIGVFLNSISTSELSEQERENIFIRKQEIKKKIKLIKKFSTQKIKNKKDFYDNLVSTIQALSTPANVDLMENSTIFTCYMQDIGSFLGEYLNTKEADFSPATLNKIRNKLASEFRRFIASFGYMSFDYLNPDAYFKPVCKELEKKVFKLENFYASNYSQVKEMCFKESLENDFDGKLLEDVELVPLEEKKGIGFLANNANIQDDKYLAYLKEILEKVQEASLVAFYFEEYQKNIIYNEFKSYESRVEFRQINGIGDVVNGCRMICANAYKELNTTLFNVLHVDLSLKLSIKEYEAKHANYYKPILKHCDKLGLTKEQLKQNDNSFLCALYNLFLDDKLICKADDSYISTYEKKIRIMLDDKKSLEYMKLNKLISNLR